MTKKSTLEFQRFLFFFLANALLLAQISAQTTIEGYVYENNNRGFLSDATVSVFQLPENYVRGDFYTDRDGHFVAKLAPGSYRLVTKRDLFYPKTDTIEVGTEKTFAKIEMQRKPGYIFDATIAEARTDPAQVVDAVTGTRVEIFNRTTRRPELVLLDHPNAFFQFTFEQGNHYTIMIRKPGFIAKRIEARVNVEGCIICVDGVRDVNPGVTEVLTANNTMGTLLSNIELEPIKIDKRIAIKNIYYDFDKWAIRPDAAKQLDKVVTLMNDNPGLTVELGSHTDSRGRDVYNDTLSQRRAEAAVEYIISKGVNRERITAKGYGETQLKNRCANGVTCSEEEHQLNRRTELRITGIGNATLEAGSWKPLEDLIREEEFEQELKKLGGEVQEIKIGADGRPIANTSTKLPQQQASSLNWQPVAANFSGFVVEFLDSDSESILDPKTNSFDELDQPVSYKKDKNGKYHYYLGAFKTQALAEQFLNDRALKVYPKAKLVQVKKGVIVP
jgi:outer membrane protein OmpA-like peptidoglycan-associated protein